jgi:hypothetical protein
MMLHFPGHLLRKYIFSGWANVFASSLSALVSDMGARWDRRLPGLPLSSDLESAPTNPYVYFLKDSDTH